MVRRVVEQVMVRRLDRGVAANRYPTAGNLLLSLPSAIAIVIAPVSRVQLVPCFPVFAAQPARTAIV
jgi:hypothetical protein